MKAYEISPSSLTDLFEIWERIAQDSIDLANRIETEFYLLFESLSKMPLQGHKRVVYQPDSKPLRIVAVLRAKRNIKKILKNRR